MAHSELKWVRAALWLLAAVSVVGCSRVDRGGGGGGGTCPNLSGAWRIADHCESSAIGRTSTLSQSGCSFTGDFEGTRSTGTVSASGAVTLQVDVDEGLTCTGSLVGNRITVDCTPGGCHVELVNDDGPPPPVDAGGGGGGGAPASACNCDSDCSGTSSNAAACIGGVCMQRASVTACDAAGSTVGCAAGLRCWHIGETPICFPDCASFSCVGQCDSDGSCVPSETTSCDPGCSTACAGGA
jgi:hypothetical protein